MEALRVREYCLFGGSNGFVLRSDQDQPFASFDWVYWVAPGEKWVRLVFLLFLPGLDLFDFRFKDRGRALVRVGARG
jgi:hypothetical protein